MLWARRFSRNRRPRWTVTRKTARVIEPVSTVSPHLYPQSRQGPGSNSIARGSGYLDGNRSASVLPSRLSMRDGDRAIGRRDHTGDRLSACRAVVENRRYAPSPRREIGRVACAAAIRYLMFQQRHALAAAPCRHGALLRCGAVTSRARPDLAQQRSPGRGQREAALCRLATHHASSTSALCPGAGMIRHQSSEPDAAPRHHVARLPAVASSQLSTAFFRATLSSSLASSVPRAAP